MNVLSLTTDLGNDDVLLATRDNEGELRHTSKRFNLLSALAGVNLPQPNFRSISTHKIRDEVSQIDRLTESMKDFRPPLLSKR